MFGDLDIKRLHHAYLLEGERALLIEEVISFFDKNNIASKGNSDFVISQFDTLAVDDARTIKERQMNRALGEKKIFILGFNFITREAQNSLLKVFEEPTENSHFFVIVPGAEILLPTLRSRLQLLRGETNPLKVSPHAAQAKKFFKASKRERLELVKALVEAIADEEKGKMDAIAFVNGLEIELHANLDPKKPESVEALNQILKCRGYLQDRSSSVKMILEHLALTL
jgi:DNA polymerase III delta prime subunit